MQKQRGARNPLASSTPGRDRQPTDDVLILAFVFLFGVFLSTSSSDCPLSYFILIRPISGRRFLDFGGLPQRNSYCTGRFLEGGPNLSIRDNFIIFRQTLRHKFYFRKFLLWKLVAFLPPPGYWSSLPSLSPCFSTSAPPSLLSPLARLPVRDDLVEPGTGPWAQEPMWG